MKKNNKKPIVVVTGAMAADRKQAAAAMAAAFDRKLIRVDLSKVVSRYIGETEKNLRRVFDRAEASEAVLFFDEADGLFEKRSEVKDAHDRYANLNIEDLLRRVETANGIAMLGTNMKSSIDPAFLRRLRFVVSFPFPGVAVTQPKKPRRRNP